MSENNKASVIIAGATGLIGHHLLTLALQSEQVDCVYSIGRKAVVLEDSKLQQLLSPTLAIDINALAKNKPLIGFIALGTTLKKAGSKDALKAIDVDLVVNVAKSMHQCGVQSIYIVSCIGASASASSHYLKCKGQMEQQVEAIGFNRVTFMQPGPLSGARQEERKDEKLLQGLMKLLNPFIKGKLLNYKPIDGKFVARAMLQLALDQDDMKEVARYTSKAMFELSKS